jgi:hypothetical protein
MLGNVHVNVNHREHAECFHSYILFINVYKGLKDLCTV